MAPPINVVVDEEAKRRILSQEERWTGPRLVALLILTLVTSVLILQVLARI